MTTTVTVPVLPEWRARGVTDVWKIIITSQLDALVSIAHITGHLKYSKTV